MSASFSKKTVEILGKRAAYKCSNPDCRVTTVGPTENPEKAILIGEAAHIFGAKNGSARFQGQMKDFTRSEITNGIWLCRNCHKLIDSDSEKFTAELLFKWREEHEKFVNQEIGKTSKRLEEDLNQSLLEKFDKHPPIVRRLVLDRPVGWEFRLGAELLKYLNRPVFRKLEDLRCSLYTKPMTHIQQSEVVNWARERISEMSTLIDPLKNTLDNLIDSFGQPGVSGDPEEILHACLLIQQSAERILEFEENIYFTAVPEDAERLKGLFKDCMGTQFEKFKKIPDYLEEVVEILGSDRGGTSDNPTVYSKTLVFDLPDGWSDKINREIHLAEYGYDKFAMYGDALKGLFYLFIGLIFLVAIIVILVSAVF